MASVSTSQPQMSLAAILPYPNPRTSDKSKLKRHNTHERNAHPSWARIQLIKHFVERLIHKKNIENAAKLLVPNRQKALASRSFAIGAQELGSDTPFPEMRPWRETGNIFGMPSRKIDQA